MRRNRTGHAGCVFSLLVFWLSAPATAHHSHASLNADDKRLFQGVVTKFSWRAPHVYITANVAMADGTVREYKVEALNPPAMANLGWSKDTFKPGDRIVWEGAHDKDLDRGYAGIEWAETPDGVRLYASAAASRAATRDATKAAFSGEGVEPVTKIGTGSWYRIAADGSTHPAIRRPADDWPLTPEYQARVDNFSEDDNPLNNCLYGGPPRNIVSLTNYRWFHPDDETILIDRDMWPEPRVIHLDPNVPRGEPSSFGHSVGRFEGDELIVETDNFVAETWGMYTGIDSSAEKSLVERYWLSDGGMRLNVEFTVTDPIALTEPYTYTHQWKRVPDRDLAKAECSLENAWLYKTADYGESADVPGSVKLALAAERGAGTGQGLAGSDGYAPRSMPAYIWIVIALAAIGIAVVVVRRR